MHETLQDVCDALDSLAENVKARSADARPLTEWQGWNHPAISVEDLANTASLMARQISELDINEISDEAKNTLGEIPGRLQLLDQQTLPQMLNGGHSPVAISAYLSTLQWISAQIQPLIAWQVMQDPKSMPAMTAKRLSRLNKQIEDISIDTDELNRKIEIINNATDAAESLPADLVSLKEARKKIEELAGGAQSDRDAISVIRETSIFSSSFIAKTLQEAEGLINQSEEAYRVSTTKGLAGAFEVRANQLARSMWVWVLGLATALGIGGWIGSDRLESLTESLNNSDLTTFAAQAILSLVSVGAPLWFAWISTKQIGQRFKLAEDYAYKASVAKAYEGYRKEAARIDPAFEARLFSSALSRVEEAPLRVMDEHYHGSPWHELVQSAEFNRAIDTIPELRDRFFIITKSGIDSVKAFAGKKANAKPEQDADGAQA